MNWILYISLLLLPVHIADSPETYPSDREIKTILKKVNTIRANGCFCGRTYMPSVGPLKWDDLLYRSALGHAKEMSRYNYFAHYSIDGKDIGDRLDDYGYDWQVAGENLGEGQKSFGEVLDDWLESKTHCQMLMNAKVTDVAVATHGRYWVQHFGKRMPARYRRVGRK